MSPERGAAPGKYPDPVHIPVRPAPDPPTRQPALNPDGGPIPAGAQAIALAASARENAHFPELRHLRHARESRNRRGSVRQATRSGGSRPSKKAVTLSTTFMPMAMRVSAVALPRCGSSTTLSMPRSASGTCGSAA